jgi:hypothetical protein
MHQGYHQADIQFPYVQSGPECHFAGHGRILPQLLVQWCTPPAQLGLRSY